MFSEVNAQIKELNKKILSLKNYINALIPKIDTSKFATKSQIFKDGNPEKGVEIKKKSFHSFRNDVNSDVNGIIVRITGINNTSSKISLQNLSNIEVSTMNAIIMVQKFY
jgi:hypothetical protein